MESKLNISGSFSPGAMELLFKLIDPLDLQKFAQVIERSRVEKELSTLHADITNMQLNVEEINKAILQKREGIVLLNKVLKYQTGENTDEVAKPLSGRNKAVYDFIKRRDNWVFRAEIEGGLDDIKLNKMRLDEPGKVYEETRQILRRAKETPWIITKPVYTVGPKSNRVVETFMYGIKDFEEIDQIDIYEKYFVERVKELGLFPTREEAEQFQQPKNA